MPLPVLPIPPDPKPLAAELRKAVVERLARGERPDVAEPMARIAWKVEAQRKDPDAFLVGFVIYEDQYNAYRRTAEWKRIRQAKLTEAGGLCQGCGRRATQVHHRDYRPRVMRGEDSNALVALCKACHEHIHSNLADGQRPSWQDQERRLFELLGSPDTPLNH